MLTPIPPVNVFGACVGFGILLAFSLTIIILPIYLSRLSPSALAKIKNLHLNRASALDNGLGLIKKTSQAQPKLVVSCVVLLSVFSYIGITKIEINDNAYFKCAVNF